MPEWVTTAATSSANERNKLGEQSAVGHANQIDAIGIEIEAFAEMAQSRHR